MRSREIHGWMGWGIAVVLLVGVPARAIVDGCRSTSSCWAGAMIVCPAGDGHQLADQGATIYVTARDYYGAPIPNIPALDWWLIGCNDGLALCGSAFSSSADGPTDANGNTTISGAIAAGGCDIGLSVVVQGVVLEDYPACTQGSYTFQCHPIEVRSPDVTGDLIIDLLDFSVWAPSFLNAAAPPCHDFSYDGVVDIVDFGIFGGHFLHNC